MQSANLLHSIFCFSVYLAQVISFAMFPYGLLPLGEAFFALPWKFSGLQPPHAMVE